MICQWQAYIRLLPQWMREPVDRLGRDSLTELRLRIGLPPQLVLQQRSLWLDRRITKEDIDFCTNTASQYSPWAAASTGQGYITASGGHRLGLCGTTVSLNGSCTGYRNVTSLCMRVARDFPGLADGLKLSNNSVLLIGPPGSGKTTLLRDLIRQRSENGPGSIAVLDERGELFPTDRNVPCFATGRKTDVLTGCSKAQGIVQLIRCMGPSVIAVDEVTAQEDCVALIHAAWCGVKILATAHAGNRDELYRRAVYKPLLENGLFDTLVILQQDKSWRIERVES